jgi:hypothetical protein
MRKSKNMLRWNTQGKNRRLIRNKKSINFKDNNNKFLNVSLHQDNTYHSQSINLKLNIMSSLSPKKRKST